MILVGIKLTKLGLLLHDRRCPGPPECLGVNPYDATNYELVVVHQPRLKARSELGQECVVVKPKDAYQDTFAARTALARLVQARQNTEKTEVVA